MCRIAGLALLIAALASCAVNPATGRRQLMVISDGQEIEIGKKADSEVRRQQGIYTASPELTRYVSGIASKIAAASARPQLEYHFDIVDSPAVNAFALPGGYVYVNRGILEWMTSEDELAAVLGHEIAHVAARHGAAQMSTAYAAQLAVAGAAIFTDPRYASDLGQLTDFALSLGFKGYSRDNERQADDLGLTYAKRAGYNPRGAVDLMRMLQRLEGEEPGRVEMWFASHPTTSERISNLKGEIRSLKGRHSPALDRAIRREEYLRQLDGMAAGLCNKSGYVSGSRYVDKPDRISLDIPKGWNASLGEDETVLVLSRPSEGYRAELKILAMSRRASAADLARDFVRDSARESLEPTEPIGGATLPAGEGAVARLRGREKGRMIEVRKLFLVRLDRQIVLTFVVPSGLAGPTEDTFRTMTATIRFLKEKDLADLPEPRVSLYRTKTGDSWASIAESVAGAGTDPATLAAYNGREQDGPPEAGLLLKIPPKGALGAPE